MICQALLTVLCWVQNLYIRLTNLYGSTLAPPVIVQSSVLLAVGNLPPSITRLKQLAQAITSSPARNLGLNHTVFGKVKQIQLSTMLQHSLNSSNGRGTSSPSPSPLPQPKHQNRYHNHYRPDASIAPAPAPAPWHSDRSSSRSSCPFQNLTRAITHTHSVPTVAPAVSPHHSSAPHLHGDPPAPSLPSPLHPRTPPASSPLPAVFFARVQPPSNSAAHTKPTDEKLPLSPPSSCEFFLHDLHLKNYLHLSLHFIYSKQFSCLDCFFVW